MPHLRLPAPQLVYLALHPGGGSRPFTGYKHIWAAHPDPDPQQSLLSWSSLWFLSDLATATEWGEVSRLQEVARKTLQLQCPGYCQQPPSPLRQGPQKTTEHLAHKAGESLPS